jgi:hypothetical protein
MAAEDLGGADSPAAGQRGPLARLTGPAATPTPCTEHKIALVGR